MNINSKLTAFAQEELVLSHNEPEREKINNSLSQLERVLKNKLGDEIKEFIRFGSYTRNTILPRKYDPYSDVDLMVVFNTRYGKKTPGTYRANLLNTITAAYPNSISKKDFPVVKLELNHIMFDIVPAYSDEIFYKSYYIPGKNDNWRITVPNDLNNSLSQKNQSYGDNIVRNVIRLCKHWNASYNYPYESYLMEKGIIDMFFWAGDNLYDKFISVLGNLPNQQSKVTQTLENIKLYRRGSWSTLPNEQKQLEHLQILLPGLK